MLRCLSYFSQMSARATAFADHLDCVFGRLVEHRFSGDTDVTDLDAPDGLDIIMQSSPRDHRIFAARAFVHPPMPTSELASVVERRLDAADDSSRLLLSVSTPHVGRNGPSRVTVGLPTSELDAGKPIEQLALMFPDQYTAPTGVGIGMSVSEDWNTRIDLASVLAPDSTLRGLRDLLDGPDHVTGLLWCDDAADMFGVPRRGATRFGMPPHFIPIVSVGVDFVTLGLLWDRPETGVLDDTTLYAVSPGGNYHLEAKVSLKGWIAGRIRDELERAEGERADQLGQVLDLVGKRTKSADLGFGGGVKRPKPRDLDEDELWAPFVYGGDGVRAPAASFSRDRLRLCSDGWTGLEAARRATEAGLAGNAIHAAGSGLSQAVPQHDAAAIHALYHALIGPLEALGRQAIADRCRALTTTLVPILNDQPDPPAPRPPLWSVPMESERTVIDVTGVEGQDEPLQVLHDGGVIAVGVRQFVPLALEALPGSVLIELLDSGAVAVGPDGEFASEHGKPIAGAQVDGSLVVASVWEEPGEISYHIECVIGWADDERRYRVVQYAPLQLAFDPFGTGSSDPSLSFADERALAAGEWPFETSVEVLQAAGPIGSVEATRLDVLRSRSSTNGLVLSEKAAAVIAPGLEHHPLQVDIGGAAHDMRYLPTPVTANFDWRRSTFAVVSNSWPPKILERLPAGQDLGAIQAANADLAAQSGPRRAARVNVAVLLDTPPVMRVLGSSLLVRSDIRDAIDRASLVGFQMGKRSDFYLTPDDALAEGAS